MTREGGIRPSPRHKGWLGRRITAGLIGALACAVAQANGSFSLPFDSVAGSGMAFAGVDAHADDLGAPARNPALHGARAKTAATMGGHLAYYSTRFSGDARREQTEGGGDISGGDGGDPGRLDLPLPDIVISHRLGSRVAVGMSLSAPFGITLRFDPDWRGRYHSIDTVIRGVELVPAVAWQATDWLRVGLGLRAQAFDSEFSNDVDLGSYVQQAVIEEAGFNATTPACRLAGEPTLPGKYDFHNRLESREFALAWQAGALLQLRRDLALGLSYRAPVPHRLDGAASRERRGWTLEEFHDDPCLTGVRVGLAAMGRSYEDEVATPVAAATSDTGFSTRLTLPETLSSSLVWQPGRWTVAGSLRWTRWSRLQSATVVFDNATPTVTQPLHFQDSVLAALGVGYRLHERWTVSAGFAQESSTVDDQSRSARAPDSERRYLSAGVGWRVLKPLRIVMSVGVIRGKRAAVRDRTAATGTNHLLAGQFEPLTLVYGGARLEWLL